MPMVTDDPVASDHKVAMLTFDDGPNTKYTPLILDILKEHEVRAMFFITGHGARDNMDLVERIHREGHILAPHTMTHANLNRLSVEQMRQEIEPLIDLIQQVTGVRPRYFRPPYGAYNRQLSELLTEYGMDLINWTSGSLDWDGLDERGYKDPEIVVGDVMKQLHPGAVILMHDTNGHTAAALPEIIRQIRAVGYEFVVLP